MEKSQIRPYCVEDLEKVEALESRVQPYRLEDESHLPPMFARALQAEQSNDRRWMAIPNLPPQSIAEEFDAFWVATYEESIVGIIGAQKFRAREIIPSAHPLAEDWEKRGSIAELRRLRVAPEMSGHGIGTKLCQTVIEWTSLQNYQTLILNTTSPQFPALQLYRKLGFQEVGISYIGKYELVWLEMFL